jgi:hypothetical protein
MSVRARFPGFRPNVVTTLAITANEIQELLDGFSLHVEEVVNSFAREIEANPAPETIYHYTDDRGLAGILESGRIRLTEIFGLNDPTELRHGVSPAIRLLRAAARRDDRFEIGQFSQNVAAMFHYGIEEMAQFFVCSFSEAGNDLGQWRAYADNGRGFSLGFDAKILERAFASAGIAGSSQHTAFPVTYNESKLRHMHRLIVEQTLPLISLPRTRVFPDNSIDEYMSELLRRTCVPIIHSALFFKHPSYCNEREYHFLQLFRADVDVPGIKHLPRRYKLTRYTEFDWRAVAVDSLKSVVTGPAAGRHARQFADECVSRFHTGAVKISQSKLPYRP